MRAYLVIDSHFFVKVYLPKLIIIKQFLCSQHRRNLSDTFQNIGHRLVVSGGSHIVLCLQIHQCVSGNVECGFEHKGGFGRQRAAPVQYFINYRIGKANVVGQLSLADAACFYFVLLLTIPVAILAMRLAEKLEKKQLETLK